MSDFAPRLLRWFDDNGRKDLPWQKDTTPYRVWVSEIMLQQTQVTTVIPYYERFMSSFSSVVALADAEQDEVLSHWSGLGYYARARNLHRTAQIVRDEFGGEFPESFDDIVALPGIGRSTAGAILSISCGQRHAILDGNVKRVLARHEAIEGWPGTTSVANQLWEVAERHTPHERVADYTQAIMDLGATLCTRTRPACDSCPVATDCAALQTESVALFPGKKPKKAKPLKTTTMVLAEADDHVLLERRPEAGIWGGLWSLPEVNDSSIEDWCDDALAAEAVSTESWDIVRHSFSHYDLDIQPVVVRIESQASKVADSDTETWHALGTELPGGIAAPVKKLIEELRKNVSHC